MSARDIWDWISANAAALSVVIGMLGLFAQLAPKPLKIPAWLTIVLLIVAGGVAFYGCAPATKTSEPALQLTEMPSRVEVTGPSEERQRIGGRVTGVLNPRLLKVVIYAHTNQWYVQPFTEQPFTELHADGSFAGETHNGDRYAVLVVQPAYQPPAQPNALPTSGGDVIAVFEVAGR